MRLTMQQRPLAQVAVFVGTGGPIVLPRGHRLAVNQIGAADCAAEGALIVKAMRFAGLCGDDFMHRDDEVSHWQPYIVPLSPPGE